MWRRVVLQRWTDDSKLRITSIITAMSDPLAILIALMMEAVLPYETSVYFYGTTRRHN
jgi:hypothetical protein